MPTGTSMVVSTRPAITSRGSHSARYCRRTFSPGSQRFQSVMGWLPGRAAQACQLAGKPLAALDRRRAAAANEIGLAREAAARGRQRDELFRALQGAARFDRLELAQQVLPCLGAAVPGAIALELATRGLQA